MNIEIECKILLQDPVRTRSLISRLGCEDKGEVFEQNWVFDKDRELESSLSLLRLRVNNNNEWGILTHKSPLAEKEFKRRREIETKVENAANLRLILESLGYGKTWYYEKRRHTFIYNEKAEIVLDRTPVLGTYIEIESDSESSIHDLLHELELDIADNLVISYREIWRQHCSSVNIPFCDWMFDNSPNSLLMK